MKEFKVKYNNEDYDQGFSDGEKGIKSAPKNGDNLAYNSGYIEGEAKKSNYAIYSVWQIQKNVDNIPIGLINREQILNMIKTFN